MQHRQDSQASLQDVIKVYEAGKLNSEHRASWVELVRINAAEAMPRLPFSQEAVEQTYAAITSDLERSMANLWLARKGDKFIGYAMGVKEKFFYNNEFSANLAFLFVAPEYRGTWAAIKLIRSFEEWARLNGVLQIYLGVARLDKDEAKHIRKLFPRLGYEWCGSYFVKETV